MANPFVHIELNTANPEKAREFYSQMFKWELEEVPNTAVPTGSYTIIKVGKGTGGGIMKQVPGGITGWVAYVEVDDINISTQHAKELGGRIMKDVTEVEDMGWLSFIQDPGGAVLGLWQTRSKG